VDVGGGNGTMLVALLRAYPALRGTLVDLPATVPSARTTLANTGLDERSTVIGGSFFDPLPTDGDVYLLSFVLLNWDDSSAVKVLQRCAEAAGRQGRVLILEYLIGEDALARPVTTEELLTLLLLGCQMRNLHVFAELTRAAGLMIYTTHRLSSGNMLLECVPTRHGVMA
jgi:hypothetical protein